MRHYSRRVRKPRRGTKRWSQKGGATNTPTFHVLICTGGKPVLKGMIDSLKGELLEGDAMTIIFDGPDALKKSTFTDEWTSGFKCAIKKIEENRALGFWGHGARNKYQGKLTPRTTFIMNADDDDTYMAGSFAKLREKCVDPNTLYIANMTYMNDRKTIIPRQNKEIIHRDISTQNGIIPFDMAPKGEWKPKYGGDFDYYTDLKKLNPPIVFLEELIYMKGGASPSNKTCVLYCYYETEDTRNNLEFFVKNGVFDSENYTYVFIINNNICSVTFPSYKNIHVLKRSENETDLQSYKWAITELEKGSASFFQAFPNIYFINSSCIGPFMPTICDKNWIEHFNAVLHGVDLIGPVIEFPGDTKGYDALSIKSDKNIPFIHSYMFGTSEKGFEVVKSVLLDMKPDINKHDIVHITERKITSSVLTKGYKIKSLLTRFKNVDVNNESTWNTKLWSGKNGATCYEIPGNYFGIDLNPLEVVFVKNIRNQNATRGAVEAGISETLLHYLKKYIEWSK